MKITNVECYALLIPDFDVDACSSAQDNLVVKITTDTGLYGIGETDTNPWGVKAIIDAPGTHAIGRGFKESYCILMFKSSLTENAKIIFFSTSSLEKSSQDDFRFGAYYWNPWDILER